MKKKGFLIKAFAFIFWIAVWQIVSMIIDLEIILPSPLSTLKTLCTLSLTADFWISCFSSMARILTGLFAGALAATLLAGLTYMSKLANALFSPVLMVIKATPVASFIILALIWIGRESVPSFITFLIVLPIIWSSVHHGIEKVDGKLIEITQVFKFSPMEKFCHLYFPAVFSSFSSAFMTSVGIAWKAGVAAEVLCTPKFSIGTSIFESKKYLETPELFAWTAMVIILSLAIERMLFKVCAYIEERSRYDKN